MGKNREEECNVRTVKGSSPIKHDVTSVENPSKQICFAFLSKEMGISDSGCTRADCKRVHKEALSWNKTFVLGQLTGLEGYADLTQAVQTSNKFA